MDRRDWLATVCGIAESDMTEQLILSLSFFYKGFPGGSAVKNLPAVQEMQETRVPFLGQEDPLEEKMATHSSILARIIPWTEDPGRLQSIGSQRVRQDWASNTFTIRATRNNKDENK